MTVTRFLTRRAFYISLLAASLESVSCSRKGEEASRPERAQEPKPAPAAPAAPADSGSHHSGITAETPIAAPPEPEPVISAASVAFRSRPSAKAWPGRPWVYKTALSAARPYRLRLLKGPDSMRVEGLSLAWTPRQAGMHPVALEAVLVGEAGDTARIRQDFVLEAEPVFSLSLKPLPAKARKGDTVAFDLRGSAYPRWAATEITVRFDHEGDGDWDTPELPLADNLLHLHAYAAVGTMAPRVEARYRDLETRGAAGAILVASDVEARLAVSPDTAEPGGKVAVDASGSKGDGPLAYFLDLDGDGRTDWADSSGGKGILKAPASGRYTARVKVRNPMGQEGTASAPLLVNARPRVTLRLKRPKANMAEPVEALVEAIDADDSLRSVRVNFTGADEGWTRSPDPDTTKGPGRWRKTFRHSYGKTGGYAIEGCAASADGREACHQARVEIFNAPPVCDPAPDVKATLGVPAEIEGKGRDPDGSIVKWEWDLDGDGKFDVASRKDGKVKYTFARKGAFTLNMRVTTADGMTATAPRKVEVRTKW